MSKVYSVDVMICATAYIRADSEDDAVKLAGEAFAFPNDASVSNRTSFGEVATSGADYSQLEGVTLSPAMTFYGFGGGEALPFDASAFECVYDLDD